jgi:hypothetical protein
VEYFFEKFDRIGIANKLTSSHINYIDMTPQELVAQWDAAAEFGTKIHKEIDEFIKKGTFPISDESKQAIEYLQQNFNLDENINSEVIIYSERIGIAGTVDLIVKNGKDGSIDIYDWKTSKRIDKTSYNNKMGLTPVTQNIMDCNYYHYSLQLSLYAHILEKEYGYKVNSLTILHLDGSRVAEYQCKYMKDTIREMLTYDRKELARQTEASLTKHYNNEYIDEMVDDHINAVENEIERMIEDHVDAIDNQTDEMLDDYDDYDEKPWDKYDLADFLGYEDEDIDNISEDQIWERTGH